MAPWTRAVVLAPALAVALGGGVVHAGRLDSNLLVTARVPVALDFVVSAPPAALDVTAADLAAGVMDVPGAGDVWVNTNSPAGYVLEVGLPAAPWLSAVEVRAAGAVALGAPGQVVRIAVPPQGAWAGGTRVDLRLRLQPDALPGERLLPLSLGLAPL